MNRKLVQHGESTLMLSLPAHWLREKGLKKGDALELVEQDGALVLRQQSGEAKPAFLDARNLGTMLIRILAVHLKHYDQVEIVLNPDQVKAVQDELSKHWPGFEIIGIKDNKYTIKSINETSIDAFDSIFRKSLMVMTTFAEETCELITKKQYGKLPELLVLEATIDKLWNYSARLINKWGYPAKPSRSNYIYMLAWKWEKLGDEIKFICKKFSNKKNPKLGNESVELLKEATVYIRSCTELFVNYKPETAAELSQKRKEILDRLVAFEGTKDEHALIHHLTNIVEFSFNCVGCWIGTVY